MQMYGTFVYESKTDKYSKTYHLPVFVKGQEDSIIFLS